MIMGVKKMIFVMQRGLIMMEMYVLDIVHLSAVQIMTNVPTHPHRMVVSNPLRAYQKIMTAVEGYAPIRLVPSHAK